MFLNPNKVDSPIMYTWLSGFYISILTTECLGAFVEHWFLIEHINLYSKRLALQLS
jgi:hypothetical protein